MYIYIYIYIYMYIKINPLSCNCLTRTSWNEFRVRPAFTTPVLQYSSRFPSKKVAFLFVLLSGQVIILTKNLFLLQRPISAPTAQRITASFGTRMFIRVRNIPSWDPIRRHINPCYIRLPISLRPILILLYIYACFLQVIYPPGLNTLKLRMNLLKTAP
jgi:hypothetical protein